MKRIYSILFASFSLLSWASCSSYLEENPKDRLDEEAAYSTLSDVQKNGVLSLYNYVGGYVDSQGLQGTGRGIYDLNTFTTDETIMPTRGGDWYDGGFWQGLYLHRWGVNNEAIYATWEYLYRTVILCNGSLERIQDFAEKHPEENVADCVAEVRALRAMFYYYIMDLFGSVPLIEKSDPAVEDIVQEKRSKVFNFIVKELTESSSLLSEERSNQPGVYYGRMTQPVVWFLLAKLALNAEVYTDDDWTDGSRPDGKSIFFEVEGQRLNAWQTVNYYCEKITAAGYTLEKDYTANFAVFNESSEENIFVIPMSKTLYTNQFICLFRSRHYNHAKAYGLSGENGSSATKEVLETFGYDTPQVDARFDYCYFAGPVKDLEGNQILLDDGVTPLVYEPWNVALDVSGKPYEKTAGARMKKYEVDKTGLKDGKLLDNDIVLFRYADVLLMQSEAKVRNGENGDAELNLVRSRVGMAPRTATLENLLDERMMELAWEGWRRQDMIRFGVFTRSYSCRPQLPGEENGYTTVFPIPEKVIDMNPQLHQHKGY
ncbi:RagB/SusD family nutrient uptake outer membrane protein [Phocaeicola plebeius]|uniref:RagB/SusD family nutrient uptake outer membrane protein n=1 Tax=Phocaeicola plebeius TaxID=310297 RepID=A0A3E4Z9N8_9BACT|nr:RagB/SusD family nutrient uptake outer membrane protein [Phocaeicola plebeius]RGM91787.1 RagB/SusD family nutrient uptake outer membrane protein [Phocaeicola plebeius]